jgi:hypothetical protein
MMNRINRDIYHFWLKIINDGYASLLLIFLLFIFVGKDQVDRSACPISGEYSGILPDGPQFCAKMSSDCNNPDIMFYNVADCNNASEILEGKE